MDQLNFRVPEDAPEGCAVPFRAIHPGLADSVRYSQVLHVPVSKDGQACADKPRDGLLRLVLVREVNSGVANLPARRDRLLVDFFAAAPSVPPVPNQVLIGNCGPFHLGGRFLGRICPGMEGAAEDRLLDTILFDSRWWNAKLPQDAGVITVSAGNASAQIEQGLPDGLPFYRSELPAGLIEPGRIAVMGNGGEHIGPFRAEIDLPPFAVRDDLSPGTVVWRRRSGLQRMRWSGGSPKGIVRWWLYQGECRELTSKGELAPWGGRGCHSVRIQMVCCVQSISCTRPMRAKKSRLLRTA